MKDAATCSWPVMRIGDIADHCLGKMLDKQKNKGTPRPYLRNLNVRWFDFDLSDLLEMKFEDHEFDRYTARKGDVLVCEGGYPGRAAIWDFDEPVFFQKAVHRVRFHEPDRNKWFLYYLLKCDLDGSLRDHFTGSGIQHFTGKALSNFTMPVPPLEEQRRIVAVLDEAMDGLARARAHAEANLESARNFFLSVLRDVFRNGSQKWETQMRPDPLDVVGSGAIQSRSRTTTQTGGRGATLRAIPGPYSLSVLRPSDEARSGWTWTLLSDLARLESGHTPSRKHPEYWGGDVPWIGIKDARDHHGTTITETLENTNKLGIANSSARVLPEKTVCLSRTASVGYVTVMGRDMATSQDFVNWICGPALLPEFLKFLLLAQGDDIRRFASGSVHQTIYFPEVKAFHICHPPVEVQKEICASLEQVAQESQRLIYAYQTKLTDIDELRQSVLQAAFSGKLT